MRTSLLTILLATVLSSVACQPPHPALSSAATAPSTSAVPDKKLSPQTNLNEASFDNGLLRVTGPDKKEILTAKDVSDYQFSASFIKVIYTSGKSELLSTKKVLLATAMRPADIQLTDTFAYLTSEGKGELFHHTKGSILKVPEMTGRIRITQAFAVYQNTEGASVFGLDGQELGRFTAKVEIQVSDTFLSTHTDIGGVLYHIAKGTILQTEPSGAFHITNGFASFKDSKGVSQVYSANGELVFSFTKGDQVSPSDSFFGHVVAGNAVLYHASGKKLMAADKAERVLVSNKIAAVVGQDGKASVFRQDGTLAFEVADVSRAVLEDIRFSYTEKTSGQRISKIIQ